MKSEIHYLAEVFLARPLGIFNFRMFKLLNSIWAFSIAGTLFAQSLTYEGTIGVPPGPGEFLNIRDIAIGVSDNKYILDGINRTIQAFDAEGNFLFKFGEYGDLLGQFKNPAALAADNDGKIYVVDSGNKRLLVFDELGTFQKGVEISGLKGGPIIFSHQVPIGVWVDGEGNIYVTDTTGTISIFNSNLVLVMEFGSSGVGNGQFSNPTDVVTDADGSIYVVDSGNNRIQVFNSQGIFQRKFGQRGISSGSFDEPTKIAIDASKNLYVTDYHNNRIQVFSNTGSFIRQIDSGLIPNGEITYPNTIAITSTDYIHFSGIGPTGYIFDPASNFAGTFGGGLLRDGQLSTPFGVSVNPSNGEIIILDIDPLRIQTFDKTGKFLSGFTLNSPYAYKSLSQACGPDGSIFVVDLENNLVHKYDRLGNFLLSFGGSGVDPGKFQSPTFVAAGRDGKVYVSDDEKATIQIFTSDGDLIKEFGRKGTGPGELKRPYGLAFDNARQIYVVDRSLKRVQIFDSEGIFKMAISVPGVSELYSVAVSRSGSTIYVIDPAGPVDHYGTILDKEGNALEKFGASGYGELQLRSPRGMVLNDDGRLIIAEWGNHRVQVLRVKRRSQNILFTNIDARKAMDPPFELSAKATSYLPINFNIEHGQDIAVLNGSVITLTGKIGNVMVKATQNGDSEFEPAEPIMREFQVGPEQTSDDPQTIVTGFEDVASRRVALSPNPANNYIKIAGEEYLRIQAIEVIDLRGERVLKSDFGSGVSSLGLDLEEISSGLYYLKATTNKGLVIRRFVKVR